MSTYRKEWPCCGDVTETDAWIPEECPFCSNAPSQPAEPVAQAEPDYCPECHIGRPLHDVRCSKAEQPWAALQEVIDAPISADNTEAAQIKIIAVRALSSHPAAEQESERVASKGVTLQEAMDIVGSYGPFGTDVNETHQIAIRLRDEVIRMRGLYEMAVKGRADFRQALREQAARRPVRELTDAEIVSRFEAKISEEPGIYTVTNEPVYQVTQSELVSFARALLARATGEGKCD